MEYAKNLRLGGYDDWRLPTMKELGEVVTLCGGEVVTFDGEYDVGKCDGNWENTQYQKDYEAKRFDINSYWSSATYSGSTSNAWLVYFSNGAVYVGIKTDSYYVRAVRSGQ